jgi:hypothetical protein
MSDIRAITYESGAAVTASDTTNDPAGPFAAIYSGTGGDIKVTPLSGPAYVLPGTPAGVIIPVAVRFVWLTGTAATGVVGLSVPPYRKTQTIP